LPRTLERALEAAGFATVGGLIGLVVFRPPAEGALAGLEVLRKAGALAVAFLLYLRLGKGLLCLAAGYGLYLVMTLAGRGRGGPRRRAVPRGGGGVRAGARRERVLRGHPPGAAGRGRGGDRAVLALTPGRGPSAPGAQDGLGAPALDLVPRPEGVWDLPVGIVPEVGGGAARRLDDQD